MTWLPEYRKKKKRTTILRDITNAQNPVGANLNDPFMDSGADELLTSVHIIDLIGLHDPSFITITFDKGFLKKILKSHIAHIRAINAE